MSVTTHDMAEALEQEARRLRAAPGTPASLGALLEEIREHAEGYWGQGANSADRLLIEAMAAEDVTALAVDDGERPLHRDERGRVGIYRRKLSLHIKDTPIQLTMDQTVSLEPEKGDLSVQPVQDQLATAFTSRHYPATTRILVDAFAQWSRAAAQARSLFSDREMAVIRGAVERSAGRRPSAPEGMKSAVDQRPGQSEGLTDGLDL